MTFSTQEKERTHTDFLRSFRQFENYFDKQPEKVEKILHQIIQAWLRQPPPDLFNIPFSQRTDLPHAAHPPVAFIDQIGLMEGGGKSTPFCVTSIRSFPCERETYFNFST